MAAQATGALTASAYWGDPPLAMGKFEFSLHQQCSAQLWEVPFIHGPIIEVNSS